MTSFGWPAPVAEGGLAGATPGDETLARWEAWLRRSFPRSCFLRPDLCTEAADGREAVWQVQVRTGKYGRVHVSDDALRLDADDFDAVTRKLDDNDWFGLVDQFVRVRIEGSGRIGTLNRTA